jgi:hypothetical protein
VKNEEFKAQIALVALLRLSGIPFSGSLNGVRLTKAQAGKAKAAGMEAGDPDLIIWQPPPVFRLLNSACPGMAIEMKSPELKPKTERAGEFSGARPEQRARLEMLRSFGWHVVVAWGVDDVLAKIRAAGYRV